MILRKFIGWTILLGSFVLGYAMFPVHADANENRVAIRQATDAPARLRIDSWPPSGWIVQQFDSLVEIRFPKWSENISTVDGLVGQLRQRVAALETDRRGDDFYIRLTLTCACTVAVTAGGSEAVLIDVFDPFGVQRASGPAPTFAPMPIRKPGTEIATAASDGRLPDGRLDVDQARERLMEQLLRAADAGIVDLKPDGQDSPGQSSTDANPEEPQEDLAADASADEASDTQTAQDQEPAKEGSKAEADVIVSELERPRPRPRPECFSDDAFVFPDLTDNRDYAQRTSDLQTRLVGEFDYVDADVAVDLAKLHLTVGLGVEAIAVLDEFAPDHPSAELYREIAMMLEDQRPQKDASVFKADCGGVQRLWRALAKALDRDNDGALEEAKVAVAELEALPRSMREHFASRLGWAAASSGAWEFARRMDAMATRSASYGYGPTGRALVLSAKLDDWHDRKKDALKKLRAARALPGLIGEEALLNLAEAALKRADLASFATGPLQEDLAILAKSDRGGLRGARAFELMVKLRDHENGRDPALIALDEGVAAGLYPAERRADLMAEIAGGVDFEDGSRPLALVYLDNPRRFADALEKPGFRRALVSSMIDLNVPALAEPILEEADFDDVATVTKLAEAFIALDDYEGAERVLRASPEGADRNRLLAGILIEQGDIEKGQEYLASLGTSEADGEGRVRVIDTMIESSIASGDIDGALELGAERLSIASDADFAERLALAALDAGRDQVPADLAQSLSKQQLARLQALFNRGPDPQQVKDLAGMQGFLDALNSEISTIEELLKDG